MSEDKMKESIIDMAKDLGIEDVEETIIGEFKPKDKLIEFIGGKGYVNFISKEATIEAKYLSGLEMDNITFKLTICDEGTVNFEEIETNFTTKEQRGRLLEIISDKTIVPFRQRMVVQELQFMSINKINDKSIPLYLSVEYQKPIEKLASIFDNEDDYLISDDQSSKLDTLMSLFDDDVTIDKNEDVIVEPVEEEVKVEYTSQIVDSFAKMKQDKIDELDKRLENKNKELSKFTNDMRLSTKKVDDAKAEIELLESRLETLNPDSEPTGYYFNVSEMLNQKMKLESDVADFIKSKISKIKGINQDAFMRIFEMGEYNIRLGTKSEDGTIVEVVSYEELSEDIKEKLGKTIGIKIEDGKLIYSGDLCWGDLVNILVQLGFAQESEFDKYCGSNSYQAVKYSDTVLHLPVKTLPIEDKNPVYQTHGDVIVECDVKKIDNPGDIRVAIYNKLGDVIKNYRNTSDLVYDIVKHIENWPNITCKDEDGNINLEELEHLDCENNGLPELTADHITISAGGDWQEPLTMTIKSDSDGKLWVTEYSLNYDDSSVKLDYLKDQISKAVARDEKITDIIE